MGNADVTFERRVSQINRRGGSWTVSAYDGTTQQFGCVILCVPGYGPGGDNLNKIHGNWERELTTANWQDVEVPHDCRFAVALWLEAGHQKKLASLFGNKYEKKTNGSSAELIIWQSRKNGDALDGPQVVVAHTHQGARGRK